VWDAKIVLWLQNNVIIPTQIDHRAVRRLPPSQITHLKRFETEWIDRIEDTDSAGTSLADKLTRTAQRWACFRNPIGGARRFYE
jgi:hypothetical protein